MYFGYQIASKRIRATKHRQPPRPATGNPWGFPERLSSPSTLACSNACDSAPYRWYRGTPLRRRKANIRVFSQGVIQTCNTHAEMTEYLSGKRVYQALVG